MKRTVLFILSLLIILGGVEALRTIRSRQKLGEPGVQVASIPMFNEKNVKVADQSVVLPEQIADYHSILGPVSSTECELLPKDTTFGRRFYTNANNSWFQVSVALMGRDRTSMHKPSICLQAQGFTLLSVQTNTLRTEGPHPYDLPFNKFIVSGSDSSGRTCSGVFLYWFVSKDHLTTSHDQVVLSIIKELLQQGVLERWAYVSFWSICKAGEEEQTYEKLRQAASQSVELIQQTSGHAH